ncbi:MAG: hypothetical protein Q9160_002185 [Pyrenula sp. 1 TL-2023]
MSYHKGYISPTRPNPHGPNDASIIIYGYIPSAILSILGLTLFTLAFLLHGYHLLRHRLYAFSLPVLTACLMETIGYIFRLLAERKDPYRINYFIIQYFLIVTAPVCLSAAIYYTLTLLVRRFGVPAHKPSLITIFRPRLILWTFISADFLCTIVQVTGASLIGKRTSDHKDPAAANNILLAGLAVQTLFFAVFLVLLAVFYHTAPNLSKTKLRPGTPRFFVTALSAAAVLVFVRTVFRLVETAQGVFGYLSVHEAFFGTLEFAPVVVAVGLLGTVAFPAGFGGRMSRGDEEKRRGGRKDGVLVGQGEEEGEK